MLHFNTAQNSYINFPLNQQVKLMGAPGSAKTSTILQKIYHHWQNGELNSNNFLLVAFNVQVGQEIRQRGLKFQANLFTDSNVRTLHSLAGRINHTFDKDNSEICQENALDCARTNVKKIGANQLREMIELSELKVIFVDEAQDLDPWSYELLCIIGEKLKIPVNLIFDPDQSIYRFRGANASLALNHAGHVIEMTENFRSSKNIVEIANAIRPIHNRQAMISKYNTSTEKVQLYIESKEKILNNLLERLILDLRKPNWTVAVIGPTSKPPAIAHTFGIGLQDVYDKYVTSIAVNDRAEIIRDYTNESCVDGLFEKSIYEIKPNVLHLLTIHRSKGLEFDAVYCINFHHYTLHAPPADYNTFEFKCLWYVALTRARSSLTLYCCNCSWIYGGYTNIQKLINYVPGSEMPTLSDKMRNRSNSAKFAVTECVEKWLHLYNHTKGYQLFGSQPIDQTGFTILCRLLLKEQLSSDNIDGGIDINDQIQPAIFKFHNTLPGKWAEQMFELCWRRLHKWHWPLYDAGPVRSLRTKIRQTIIVPDEYASVLQRFQHDKRLKWGDKWFTDMITKEIGKTVSKKLIECLEYILSECQNLSNKKYCHPFCVAASRSCWLCRDKMLQILQPMAEREEKLQTTSMDILTCIVFNYQMEKCDRILWLELQENKTIRADLDEWFKQYEPIIEEQAHRAPATQLRFQQYIIHPLLPIEGRIDCCQILFDRKNIIELKFVRKLTPLHMLQCRLYQLLMDPLMCEKNTIELWNLRDSQRIILPPLKKLNLSAENKGLLLDILYGCIQNSIPDNEEANLNVLLNTVHLKYWFDYKNNSITIQDEKTELYFCQDSQFATAIEKSIIVNNLAKILLKSRTWDIKATNKTHAEFETLLNEEIYKLLTQK